MQSKPAKRKYRPRRVDYASRSGGRALPASLYGGIYRVSDGSFPSGQRRRMTTVDLEKN